MLCELCKKNAANVHIVKIINGVKQEMNICDECANIGDKFKSQSDMKMIVNPLNIQNLLGGIIEYMNNQNENKTNSFDACPNCNLSYDEFKRTGLLGCSKCYEHFYESIMPVIKRIQGNVEHNGKIPLKSGKDIAKRKRVIKLKSDLKLKVANEEYEEAARIRDEIRKIENEKLEDKVNE